MKICKMCCMKIPEKARKCPHCHHFQDRLSLVLYHPGFGITLATLPVIVMMIFVSRMFDTGKDFELYKDQIVITDSQMAFGRSGTNTTVAVLGTIKNNSPVPWRDIQFHVDIFDAQGKRVDVAEQQRYGERLSTNSSSSFKISFRREFPETNYVKHAIRVVGARDARARGGD